MNIKILYKDYSRFIDLLNIAFAEVIDVNDQEMIKLSNTNIPIVDVRRNSDSNRRYSK